MNNPTNENSAIIHSSVDSDLFYRSLFEYNQEIVYFCDIHGVIEKPNESFCKILGYPQEEIVSHSIERFLPQSELSEYREAFTKVLGGEIQRFYTLISPKKGNPLTMFLTLIPVKSEEKMIGVFGVAKDMTKRKLTEQSLKDSELIFKSIVEGAFIGVYILEECGQISYGNRQFYQLLGIKVTEGLNIWDYIHPEDTPDQKSLFDHLMNGEDGKDHSFRLLRKDGTLTYVEAHSKKVFLQNNQPTVIGALQDITERKKAEELTKHLANYDSLTDLPNRRFFQEKLEQTLILSRTFNHKFAILYLDLDRFKYTNDTLGHRIGDKLIKQIAARINMYLGENDVLARSDGDSFSILLPNISDTNQAVDLAKTMLEAVEEPFLIDTYNLFITTSIGISIFPEDGEDAETLIKHADSALYKAKEKGKNTYQIHTSSIDAESYRIFTLEADLRQALEQNQLELYYQPKVSADTYQITGAEALIRWNHPEWGIVSPDDFIPLAVETGIITEIEEWIANTVCFQNKAWQNAGLPAIPLSMNLSAHRFLETNMICDMVDILAKNKLDPEYLEIEILETTLLENEKTVFSVFDELKKIGIRISIDDFGTGYSSLSYLTQFKGRIDTLKIDRSFISNLSQADVDDTNFITKTIIQLAQHLKMEVVAEGVETKEQMDILADYKCNKIQGYLFSKPVPASEFAALLRQGKINPPAITNASFTVNRRRFFRIVLDYSLSATMTLIRIHGRNVQLGRTEVLIENIGLGGLRFLSNLRLAIHRDVILEFETEILGSTVKMQGAVVWMKEMKAGIFQYGLEFSMEESEHPGFTQSLNKLAILLRKNPLVPDCSFVTVDRHLFFKNKKGKTKK